MVDLFDFGFGVLAIHDTHDSRFSFLDSRSVGLFPTSDLSSEGNIILSEMISRDAVYMHLRNRRVKKERQKDIRKNEHFYCTVPSDFFLSSYQDQAL